MTTQGLTNAAGNFGSPTQLLILLAIVILLFGGKRLRNLGSDIGSAIKGFKNSVAPTEAETAQEATSSHSLAHTASPTLSASHESEKNSANRIGG